MEAAAAAQHLGLAPACFAPGDYVRLHGLSRSELNGRCGLVLPSPLDGECRGESRVVAAVDGIDTPLSLHCARLKRCYGKGETIGGKGGGGEGGIGRGSGGGGEAGGRVALSGDLSAAAHRSAAHMWLTCAPYLRSTGDAATPGPTLSTLKLQVAALAGAIEGAAGAAPLPSPLQQEADKEQRARTVQAAMCALCLLLAYAWDHAEITPRGKSETRQ